jgi:hypothetical protein
MYKEGCSGFVKREKGMNVNTQICHTEKKSGKPVRVEWLILELW